MGNVCRPGGSRLILEASQICLYFVGVAFQLDIMRESYVGFSRERLKPFGSTEDHDPA